MAPFLADRDTTPEACAPLGHPEMTQLPFLTTSMADTAADLALAVELKFLLPILADTFPDPDPNDSRPLLTIPYSMAPDDQACRALAYNAIANTIQKAGHCATTIHAINSSGLAERNFWRTHWIVKKANSAEPGPEEKRPFARYTWVSVEISSPKMAASDPETRRHLQTVLEALAGEHRLVANYTCEVHVHLGRMDDRSFSLSTLKRLGSLLWVAEPTLRSIRNPKSPNYDNVYTWGSELRRFSRLAAGTGERDPYGGNVDDAQMSGVLSKAKVDGRDKDALIGIWRARNHLELGRLLSGSTKQYRRLGFNFSSFGMEDERATRSPRTVEFRMMEGTVRSDLILNWVAICTVVAEVAVTRDDVRFKRALERLLVRLGGPPTQAEESLGRRRGREFRELMQDLEVPRAVYAGFEDKVIREH
ncbi:hypothetical protein OQA88_4820 [Cercophora sp. LCS_1]